MRTKLVDGVPTPMTAAEETARDAEEAAWSVLAAKEATAKLRLKDFDDAVTLNAVIQSFKTMTATQFDAWWDTNVINAPQLIAFLKVLMKLIIRRLL